MKTFLALACIHAGPCAEIEITNHTDCEPAEAVVALWKASGFGRWHIIQCLEVAEA